MTIALLDPPAPEILDDLTRRELVTAALAAGLLAAYGGDRGSGVTALAAGRRVVDHVGGTTEITGIPERVVALAGGSDLEALCLAGVKPIAAGQDGRAAGEGRWGEYIESRCDLEGVEYVPGRNEANLERLAALRPDLILAVEFYTEVYDKLSRIAPTVLLDRGSGTESLLAPLAVVFDRPDLVETALARIEKRKAEVAAALPEGLEISVAYTDGTGFFAFFFPTPSAPENGAALIRELGVRSPAHQIEAVGGEEIPDRDSFEVSPERLDLLDGQNLVLRVDGDAQKEQVVAKLGANPLWQSLEAVQSGKVWAVEGHWAQNGPLAQLAVLDDLEAFFGTR